MRVPLDSTIPELEVELYHGPEPHWQLDEWEISREGDPGHVIIVQPYRGKVPALDVLVHHTWPQNELEYENCPVEMKDNGAGELQPMAQIFMGGDGASNFDVQGHGPHNICIPPRSDMVFGCGMPMNRHTRYRFVYHFIEGQAVITIGEAAWAACPKPMPVNTRAFLYQAAKKLMVNPQVQTAEFEFGFEGINYVGQLFNGEAPPFGGIAACEVGHYDMAHLLYFPKPGPQ